MLKRLKIKEFVSLTAIICIVMCSAMSCGLIKNDPKKTWESLDDPKAYKASVNINYASDDIGMATILTVMNKSNMEITTDGTDVEVVSSVDINGTKLYTLYKAVNGVLYQSISIENSNGEAKLARKADISESQMDAVLSDLGVSTPISESSFEELTFGDTKNTLVWTCVNESGKDGFENVLEKSFGEEYSINAENICLTAVYDGKAVISKTFTCDLELRSQDGQTYSISMTMTFDYDYSGVIVVLPPSNAADYTVVDYKEIIG